MCMKLQCRQSENNILIMCIEQKMCKGDMSNRPTIDGWPNTQMKSADPRSNVLVNVLPQFP